MKCKTPWALAAGLALALTGAASHAADGPEPRLIVSYVEAPAGQADALLAKLNAFAQQTRRDPEHPRVLVLRELGRPARMVVLEQWAKLSAAEDGKVQADLEAQAGQAVQAPIDRRLSDPLMPEPASKPGAFHVLMHVDVVPEGAPLGAELMKAQKDAVMAAPGALGFEAAVQDNRANHFAVHEVWASRRAYEAYTASAPAREFRQKLATVKGALFDDRYYAPAPVR